MLSVVLWIILIGPLNTAAAIHNPVRIEEGFISGVSGRSPQVRVFKGIPYAAAPVGKLRWRPPEPAAHWQGVRKADAFGHACMQETAPAHDNPMYAWLLLKKPPQDISEDCLFLNVWTAARSADDRRPVMVFLHGGGFIYGSGAEGLYDGEALAKKGVVYVDVNYRLGVFGFLAYPELSMESEHHVSGNYAFLDQIAALRWVRRNIAAFGGDPARVTIFGQSAGSRSVIALTASPLAKGLFQRVISESHGYFGPGAPTLPQAEQAGLRFAAAAGASSLAELRSKSADELMKAQVESRFRANLTIDGWFMPAEIYTIFAAGKQNDAAVIAGSTSDESSGYSKPITTAAFIDVARRRYGRHAETFLKFYPADSNEEAMKSEILSGTDQNGAYEARAFAQLQARTGKGKSYLYLFSHKPPVAGPDSAVYDGVFHGAELYYVFQQYDFRSDWAWTEADRKLGDIISSYWVNFAANGNPNGKGLPKWPGYNDNTQELMNFGSHVSVVPEPRKAELDFFETVFHPQGDPISGRMAQGTQ